jgi:hypothetical protein
MKYLSENTVSELKILGFEGDKEGMEISFEEECEHIEIGYVNDDDSEEYGTLQSYQYGTVDGLTNEFDNEKELVKHMKFLVECYSEE